MFLSLKLPSSSPEGPVLGRESVSLVASKKRKIGDVSVAAIKNQERGQTRRFEKYSYCGQEVAKIKFDSYLMTCHHFSLGSMALWFH